MRKFLKSTIAITFAVALLTSNTNYTQAAQLQLADTITESVINEPAFASSAADKQQSKAVVQAKSKKSANTAYNKKAKKAYKKFLKGYFEKGKAFTYEKIKYKWNENFSPDDREYAIYDINNDGKLELILCTEQICGSANPTALFIYYKGKVKCIGMSRNYSYYCGYKKGNLISDVYGKFGYFTGDSYIIKDGKLKLVASYYTNAESGEPKEINKYWIGKKRVSEKKYNNFIKKKTGGSDSISCFDKLVKYK